MMTPRIEAIMMSMVMIMVMDIIVVMLVMEVIAEKRKTGREKAGNADLIVRLGVSVARQ